MPPKTVQVGGRGCEGQKFGMDCEKIIAFPILFQVGKFQTVAGHLGSLLEKNILCLLFPLPFLIGAGCS